MKKAISNILPILVALAFLASGIYLVSNNPTITGLASSNPRVEQDVINKINQDGEAKVIIFLKDKGIGASSSQNRNNKIKQNQDEILSNLDYEDIRDKGKKISGNKDLKLKHKYSTINAISGNITQEGLLKLQNNPDVEKIVLVKQVSIDLADSVPLIEADKVWEQKINGINLTGQGQSICIIDTGIDYHHTALGNCTLTNVTQHKCKVISGYDFVNNDNNPVDDNDHGTHVAGIAAGNGPGVIGVAKNATLIAIKALSASGSGDDADVAAGIDWCITNATRFNISVVSMSLGDQLIHPGSSACPTSLDSPIEDAMESAVAANLSVFAASGNQASNSGINYPACSPFAISVGASDGGSMASLTNTHSLLDMVAPGVNIVSAKRAGTTVSQSGTSMATPHAAGVAAILYQKEKLLNNRKPKQSQILNILKRSNVSISDSGLSFPRINAVLAVKSILKLNITENSATANDIKLKFTTATNLENLSEAFVFRNNFISLNSSKYAQYNKSANITFFNLTFSETPVVLRNGVICSNCEVLNYDGQNLTFNVSGFTNYTSAANAQLQIFDQADPEGGSLAAKVLDQIKFFANYTNITSGNAIAGNCAINFTDLDGIMTFNSSTNLSEYNRTFSSSAVFGYNITCSAANYETLNLSDSIFVQPKCLDQTPNNNITITKTQKINCTSETLRLRNQSINVYGNLIINNTVIVLEVTGTSSNGINLYNRSNLTIINSILNGTVNSYNIFGYNLSKIKTNKSYFDNTNLDIRANSSTILDNVTSDGSITLSGVSNNSFSYLNILKTFEAQGDSRNIIKNSILSFEVLLEENSRTKINDSDMNKTFFRDSSNTEISNVTILNISQLGNSLLQTPLINFTRPKSNVTNIFEIRFRSKIYGHVDLPSIANTYTAINVQRFYPVQVNFTDGSPAQNKRVIVRNQSNNVVIANKTTDSNGFVNINVNFTQVTRFANHTISVNPSTNISLLTDTPLIFTLSDTTPPAVSLIQPTISDEDTAINYNATVTDDVAVNECRLYIDGALNGPMTVTGTLANRTVTMPTPGIFQFLANCTDTTDNFNDTSVTSVTILDLPPPVILTINHSGKTNQSIIINWTTNLTSNTTVNYGTALSLGTKSSINNNVINHTRSITGLQNNTLYFYNVTSCNNQGCAVNGAFNFTTKQNTVPSSGGSGGGGGGSAITCTNAWLCDPWSDCVNSQQSRDCIDLNGCSTPKTEKQSCIVQPKIDRQGGHSGTLEPIKEITEPTASAILETPKASMIKQSYLTLIWLVITLLILILFARRVDTFPLALWKEEKYIKKGDSEKAERLFDKLITRFGRSKERERKYVEKVEELAEELGNVKERPSKQLVFKPGTEVIYKETQDLSYNDLLKEYKKVYNEYLSMPKGERDRLEPQLSELKRKLAKAANKEDLDK